MMNWFGGNIAEAVTYSQTKQTLFCVAILGTDDSSRNLELLLNDEIVTEFISNSSKFTCIKLLDGTEEHGQFLALYPNATAPSIFCITIKGAVIEVITNPINNSGELKGKFENALAKHDTIINQINSQGSRVATPSSSSTFIQEGTSSSSSTPTASAPTAAAPTAAAPLEERIERAKKLAAAKAQKKIEEEAEEKKRHEIDRRSQGKGVVELRRWQEDQETLKLAEERRRDKKADLILKQKLREQIAQDRIDRQARDQPIVPVSETTVHMVTTAPPKNYTGQARLQFRLPSGSTHNHSFEPENSLQQVREYLISNSIVTFRDFTISVAFPRRHFTIDDYRSTLRDLGLLPSTALLILPVAGDSIIAKAGNAGHGLYGYLTTFIGFMIYPITILFTFIQRAITPSTPGSTTGTSSTARNLPSGSGGGNLLGGRNNDNATTTSKSSDTKSSNTNNESNKTKRRRGKGGGSTKPSDHFGADGNVHRLHGDSSDDDSDEQATWNGNSTQQM